MFYVLFNVSRWHCLPQRTSRVITIVTVITADSLVDMSVITVTFDVMKETYKGFLNNLLPVFMLYIWFVC